MTGTARHLKSTGRYLGPPLKPVPAHDGLVLRSAPDYEPPSDGPMKAVAVRWHVGDRVRQRHQDRATGTVAWISVNPGCVVYMVTLDDGEEIGCYACELEDAGCPRATRDLSRGA